MQQPQKGHVNPGAESTGLTRAARRLEVGFKPGRNQSLLQRLEDRRPREDLQKSCALRTSMAQQGHS